MGSERVDDKAWRAVRSMLLACLVLWTIILIGRIVESIMGERMLVSNAGAPPWSRVGAWDGWEFGPTSSKHYMHVSPAQGHFFWREGENNAANKEITPSDLFGSEWWCEVADVPPLFLGPSRKVAVSKS